MAVILIAALIGVILWRVYLRSKNEKILLGGALVIALVITPILWTSYLPLAGLAGLLLFAEELAVIGYSVCSWLVTTPDRAQSIELFLILSTVILMVIYLNGGLGEFVSKTKLHLRENIDNRIVVVLFGSLLLLAVGTVCDPTLLPLLVTQYLLVLVVPGLVLLSVRRNLMPTNLKWLADAGNSALDDDSRIV